MKKYIIAIVFLPLVTLTGCATTEDDPVEMEDLAISYTLTDSGQTRYFDAEGNIIDAPSEDEAYYGQDAQYVNIEQTYEDNEDGTITDLNTGFMWQQTSEFDRSSFDDAQEYVENLELGGYTDWRLPTIDELRTVVLGYIDIEPGGRCKVGAKCLYKTCLFEGQKSEDDYPCSNKEELELLQGPGPLGCFFDDVWREYCGYYWSASRIDRMVDENVFALDFSDPSIFAVRVETDSTSAFARCVRK